MTSRFNPKLLGFYVIATGAVLTLFSVATTYGEAHLLASSRVDGRYPLSTKALPGCLAGKRLTLTLQQSGVYLSGSLLPDDADDLTLRIAQDHPFLTGTWHNHHLDLSGTLPYLDTCQGKVHIQGDVKADQLSGTISLDAVPQAVSVTAPRQVPPTASTGH